MIRRALGSSGSAGVERRRLIVAAGEPDVWGVITDGAFPTQGTMVSYMLRWAEIYVPSAFLRGLIPMWLFGFLAWRGRRGTGAVAELPVSRRRVSGGPAGAPALADDSR